MKYFWPIVAVIGVVAVAGAGYWWYHQKTPPPPTPSITAVAPSPTTEPPLVWKDQAQFTFQYPKDVTINPHDEDKTNYAHVELTVPGHPGHLIVWVKDTTATTLDAWIKAEKQTGAIDTMLAGLPAKKTLGVKENTLLLTTLRNGYLYQVEGDLEDRPYWDPILSTVTSSFAFTAETGDDTSSSTSVSAGSNDDTPTSSDDTANVEEETIQ